MGKLNVPTDEYAISPKRKFRDLSEEFIEENKDFIVKIPANEFIYDKDNEKYYGEITDESVQDMALDMMTDGFKGVIMAYPITVDGQRKYQIESGHRRCTAAKSAGITEIPTIITEPPKTDSERVIRLIKMNLHGRPDLSPTKKAKIIEALMSAHKEERIKAGLKADNATLTDIVSTEMELSTKSIDKYKALLKLVPKLQVLADSGIAFSALIQAVTLPEDKQEMLAFSINSEISESGIDNISRQWVINKIEILRREFYDEPKQPKKIAKRRDGSKIITKCLKDFDDLVNGNAIFKENEKHIAVENLKKLRENIDKKIDELSE